MRISLISRMKQRDGEGKNGGQIGRVIELDDSPRTIIRQHNDILTGRAVGNCKTPSVNISEKANNRSYRAK